MEVLRSRIRGVSVTVALIGMALGCTSGSDAVPVPGADAVVDGAGPTSGSPSVTDTVPDVATTDDPTVETAEVAPPRTVEQSATTRPASTTAPSITPAPTVAEGPPPATDGSPDEVFLRVGDEGDEVGLMQFKLSVLGYLPVGSDSGVFDQATENGLRRFQADYGLGVDGVFGPLTGRALNAAAQSVATET